MKTTISQTVETIKNQLMDLGLNHRISAYVQLDENTLKCVCAFECYVIIEYVGARDSYNVKTFRLDTLTLEIQDVKQFKDVYAEDLPNYF